MHDNKNSQFIWIVGLFLSLTVIASGCSNESSYPADKLEESLRQITKTEYGIEELHVKIVDKTIGVYLPLKKLFVSDFKDSLNNGKIDNVEALFEPSPEAMDKVEDVLFSISRVLLSTDKPLDFYVLQATDVENTGLQLVLKGNVQDIKRVRIWDIPRSEYRKRVIHELRLNPAVLWHRPVRRVISQLTEISEGKIESQDLRGHITPSLVRHLFFEIMPSKPESITGIRWYVEDMRSTELNNQNAVVYAKVRPITENGFLTEDAFEYLFIVSSSGKDGKITRIIPFQFRKPDGGYEKIDFPEELQIEANLSKWNEEFLVEPFTMGGFLAQQMTRRLQNILTQDERILNTVREAKLEFVYEEAPEPEHFSLNIDVRLRDGEQKTDSIMFHEDMIYILNLASREFVDVMRSYQFGNYDHLRFNVTAEPHHWLLGREELELFRQNKMNVHDLMSSLIKI